MVLSWPLHRGHWKFLNELLDKIEKLVKELIQKLMKELINDLDKEFISNLITELIKTP